MDSTGLIQGQVACACEHGNRLYEISCPSEILSVQDCKKGNVKLSRYTPWRRLEGQEV
jgi:hypothetical protein